MLSLSPAPIATVFLCNPFSLSFRGAERRATWRFVRASRSPLSLHEAGDPKLETPIGNCKLTKGTPVQYPHVGRPARLPLRVPHPGAHELLNQQFPGRHAPRCLRRREKLRRYLGHSRRACLRRTLVGSSVGSR